LERFALANSICVFLFLHEVRSKLPNALIIKAG
jgi:hypothetical protein